MLYDISYKRGLREQSSALMFLEMCQVKELWELFKYMVVKQNKKFIYFRKFLFFMSATAVLGFTIKFIGEILLAVSVYVVHNRVAKEKRIDKHIVKQIHKEKYITLVALVLIVVGYLLELPAKLA